MKNKTRIAVFWFRRDLRIDDNHGFYQSLLSGYKILPIFIFDTNILSDLDKDDARVSFIYQRLSKLHQSFRVNGSALKACLGSPLEVFEQLSKSYQIEAVYTNKDYEPYAKERDQAVATFFAKQGIKVHVYKDQVVFEESEVVKDNGQPYTVFTPYKNKWLSRFDPSEHLPHFPSDQHLDHLISLDIDFPTLASLGFEPSKIRAPETQFAHLSNYHQTRDFPAQNTTSYTSVHLRFGTISTRAMIKLGLETNETYLSELIWRSFFMQILHHFPDVVEHNFKRKYDGIVWRNNELEFKKWCDGQTGYPLVDAGMRELNETGFMHNRVRMVTAGFLCKHLLIDWRWGEAYFAKKLLDYDLSANNGNWQWAAGTGCDAAPYFRIFNPHTQLQKFDKKLEYVRKWVKDFDELTYPTPIVDHKLARERCLKAYKMGLGAE